MALHLASLWNRGLEQLENDLFTARRIQFSSYVCCVQSPLAHLLEKQVFQKGMFDPKTNEIGIITTWLRLSQSSLQWHSFILLCRQDFSPLMRANFSDPKAGRFMNYRCSQSHKRMRAKVTWSIKHSRLTLTFGGKLKSKSFKRGKCYAFATASLARSLRELIDLTSLALGLLTNFYPVLVTKRGREEASLVLKMQRPCSIGLPG